MDRLACVDIPALPLQLLLRAHPEWARGPAAVVANDRPQGEILSINKIARQAGVTEGMRAGTARALAPALATGVISEKDLDDAVLELTGLLRNFSARVEPGEDEPGLFWLDASGLLQIFGSLDSWGEKLRAALVAVQMRAGIAVGFSRFSTAAIARALRGTRCLIFATPIEEERACFRVPLARSGLPAESLALLEQLGIGNIGQFLELPAAGILRRFGPAAHRLRRLAAGELAAPLQPLINDEPLKLSLQFDDGETDRARLTFLAKQLLDALLIKLAARGEAAADLTLCLSLQRSLQRSKDEKPEVRELVEILTPAEATLEVTQLLGLLHLRLEALALPAGVIALSLAARGTPATREQLELHAQKPKRDLAAAGRAFARLRAAFGESAVVRAKLETGHLPEARFSWEPLAELNPAQPRELGKPQLIRRIRGKAALLPPRESREPDGWLIAGLSGGRVVHLDGPHRVSGGWWQTELERDYYFAETSRGELLWVFYDRRKRRWLLQGAVA